MIGARQRGELGEHFGERRGRVLPKTLDVVFTRRIMREELHCHPAGSEGDGCRGIRQLIPARRDLERSAADVEEQQLSGRPAEPAPHGEEGELGLGLSVEHLQRLAEGSLDAGDHVGPVPGVAHRARRGGEQLVDPLGLRDLSRPNHSRLECSYALFGDRTVVCEVPHQPQDGAIAGRRQRSTPGANIGGEHVDGVGTDVEDSEAHA